MSLSSEKTGLDELPVGEKGGCSDGERRGDGAGRVEKLKNRERSILQTVKLSQFHATVIENQMLALKSIISPCENIMQYAKCHQP